MIPAPCLGSVVEGRETLCYNGTTFAVMRKRR
jgi:hypothetical protein